MFKLPVKQHHAHQRGSVGYIGVDISGLAVPHYRNLVDFKDLFTAIGQGYWATG